MPDPAFAKPRLAALYDIAEGERADLGHYAALVDEFGARSVLDVGCGTGTFACLLAERGLDVVGVDPAEASLEIARSKQYGDRVRWISGDATTLPPLQVDLASMTGNVAQVFLDDDAWIATLRGIRRALRPAGRLVFEVRDPARRAWEDWARRESFERIDVPGVGPVESWVELTDVSLPFVSFRWTFRFERDGAVLTSDSTLRFRDRTEVTSTLATAGFSVDGVRDAPDRPGKELVFVAAPG